MRNRLAEDVLNTDMLQLFLERSESMGERGVSTRLRRHSEANEPAHRHFRRQQADHRPGRRTAGAAGIGEPLVQEVGGGGNGEH